MKAIGGLLIVLALLCGAGHALSHSHQHDSLRSVLSPKGLADVVESAPVVSYVNVAELVHGDLAQAVSTKQQSTSSNIVAASSSEHVEDQQPNPPTSFPAFDLTGKLAGDYDPFSQVRHLVDGVFKQHEEQLKADAATRGGQLHNLPPSAPSSFLEVHSYIRRSHHTPTAASQVSWSTVGEVAAGGGEEEMAVRANRPTRVGASYSMHPKLTSTAVAASSLPVRFSSPTTMSAGLLAKQAEGDTVEAHYADDTEVAAEGASFLQVSSKVTKVQSFCEICILVMQMKERGEPHLCAGLNANYYITCVEVLESILRADKALVYWLKEGCMHLDSEGPEIVRPCPAINICSWVPNLFTPPPTIVRDEVEALCPKDLRFLPTIPEEYRALLGA